MKKNIKVLLTVVLFLFAGASLAVNKDYELVKPAQPTSTGNKIEVLEFFWYGCPHCYKFEPFVENWLKTKPDNVEFVKVPAVLNPQWVGHARAYYAAQLMGIEHEFSVALFEALHKERKRLYSQRQVAEFAKTRLGVDYDEFMDTMASFAVETKIRRAKQLTKSYGLSGVPTVIINGKYKTDASLAKGHAGVIDVINRMIALESK